MLNSVDSGRGLSHLQGTLPLQPVVGHAALRETAWHIARRAWRNNEHHPGCLLQHSCRQAEFTY
eukprot:986340-Pelagomonas_calceolata.AAC.4